MGEEGLENQEKMAVFLVKSLFCKKRTVSGVQAQLSTPGICC
jgi:hypothetical protein